METRNILSKAVIFVAGAAVGSLVTWKIVKTKYEQIAQEEIDSVKELYSKRAEQESEPDKNEEQVEVSEEDVKEYKEIIKASNYVTESNTTEIQNDKKEDEEDMDRPYVISPDEFDENGYETISLTYYADGVLVDEFGGKIDESDWDEMIGADFAEHFGEYEDDSVFVRNDSFRIDYEILKDLRNFSEVN